MPAKPVGRSDVAAVIARDAEQPPSCLFETSSYQGSQTEYEKRRYFDPDFHALEVERVWKQVWQMACREEEMPEPGDYVVYDIADSSILIIRAANGGINAFYNSCLHRGSQLAPSGDVSSVSAAVGFRCRYHGWTYSLEGGLTDVPCEWDFQQPTQPKRLQSVACDTWGGFVFVNMNAKCEPLSKFLGILPDHFRGWGMERRRIQAHVAKVIDCNWKIGLEAFLEGYHVGEVHPQALKYTGDVNGQLDVWEPHISRMVAVLATASPRFAGPAPTQQEIVDEMRGFLAGEVGDLTVPPGGSARSVLAGALKRALTQATQVDHSVFSTCEVLDAINYLVFPNFMPWAGYGTPIVYRLRPFQNDPNRSILEVYLLYVVPENSPPKDVPPVHWLNAGESWTAAPELGGLGAIFDQDEQNFLLIQRGVKAGGAKTVTLASYQESRIRHLHDTIDRYIARNG